MVGGEVSVTTGVGSFLSLPLEGDLVRQLIVRVVSVVSQK